ncbi:uncharacterized protein Dana_GF13115, isoform A [Drosophila ananassae]|uniref:Uncharacterized protein, isoform A n=1 Tax=Drosophila ananassae TaxID=7217 RepID=B3MG59_DROAN|nr:facilitated trehalose transporter Tret1-2 homolog [Drosophila ananassae]EDV36754.1 uncharacterized protein Dana_GF13115, isoform A [Drosophila ananassae]
MRILLRADTHVSFAIPADDTKPNRAFTFSQLMAALTVSLCSMVLGFTAGYTSPALITMTDQSVTPFEVSPQAASWVGGIMPLAGLAGGICGGPFIMFLGRKTTIQVIGVPFMTAGILIGCAMNVFMVLSGRFLAGFCVGVASLALPVYLGESLHPEVRGTLGLLPTGLGNIGILVCYVAGAFMRWDHLAFFGAALLIPYFILMFFMPESPRWYVGRGREDNARKSLIWLRGKDADVEPELKILVQTQAEADSQANQNYVVELMKPRNLKPLSISLGLMFFQQFSGINAVIFYTVSIFKDAGSTIDSYVCTIIVGVVNFMATFVATALIDKVGRKILLHFSNFAMILTLSILGAFFYCKDNGPDVSDLGWLPLTCFVVYVIGFSMGFGPIPWLMMGEILPAKVRGPAASVVTSFNWACTFIVTKTFQDMIDSLGTHGAFWLFAAVCVVGVFFVIFFVPETRGKTLEEIEQKLTGTMSAMINFKPLPMNM